MLKRHLSHFMITLFCVTLIVGSFNYIGNSIYAAKEATSYAVAESVVYDDSCKVVTFEVSMYYLDNLTADGSRPKIGTVAAPSSIDFGSEIYLDEVSSDFPSISDTVYTVNDRGSNLKYSVDSNGNEIVQIRLWTDSKALAKAYGTRKVLGRIY